MDTESSYGVLSDAQWRRLSPLVEAVRPRGKTEPTALRRTIEAIAWRHVNGAKWRAVPPDLGPWWMAAQCFNRWFHLGVWERLLEKAQAHGGGARLGMAFLDGSNIRAHRCAAGAAKKRLSWLSSIVSLFYDLPRAAAPQGWRCAPPPSAASALTRRDPCQSGF